MLQPIPLQRQPIRMAPTRREFLATAATLGIFAAAPANWRLFGLPARGIRITARPKKPTKAILDGVHPLGLGNAQRDGLVYIPKSLDPKKPAPLMLALHGATQDAKFMEGRTHEIADALGCALLVPDSRDYTWDGIQGEFGVDVDFINKSMDWLFDRVTIDPKRIWLAGFSDGASYGLTLGLANGDLFGRIVAFSPGFVRDEERSKTRPRIFVSHGTNDQILPIERTSRRLVPELRQAGYSVRYDEFEGRHGVPPQIAQAAIGWLKTP
jgi:phospholipase/carboxylesterase